MLIAAVLLVTTCKKDETINYNSASGQLTAGKTMTALDLKGLKIFLWKVQEGIDISKGSVPMSAIAFKDSMTLGQDGTFAFNNLENGNYLLNLTDGFLLGTKKMSVLTIDGKTVNRITQSVEKAVAENVDTYPYPAERGLVGKAIKRHRFNVTQETGLKEFYIISVVVYEGSTVLHFIQTYSNDWWYFDIDLDEKSDNYVELTAVSLVNPEIGFRTKKLNWNDMSGDGDASMLNGSKYIVTKLSRISNTHIFVKLFDPNDVDAFPFTVN
jgi:hypothetical protein